jgi:hypothetical protein
MKWHYTGKMAIHHPDGTWDLEQVSGVFALPDHNVELIRNFLWENRSFILNYKYNPPFGNAPWGNTQSQAQMRSELANRMSDDEWTEGVKDKQVKAYLIAFYHHFLNNVDLYVPEPLRVA